MSSGTSDPARGAIAVTLDATIAPTARGLFVGSAGNVSVVTSMNETVTFTGCQAGQILPVRIIKVNTVGTTATGLVALY